MRFVRNEWMKLLSKKSSWVMVALIALLAIAPAFLVQSIEQPVSDSWKSELREQMAFYESYLTDETMDAESKQFYEHQLLIAQHQLDHNIAPQGTTLDSYMESQVQVLSIFVTIFAVVVGAGIVSSEFSTGTIKMLLTRPVKRWKILLSKLVATISFGFALYAIGLLLSIVIGALIFGTTTSYGFEVVDGQVVEGNVWQHIALYFFLSLSNFFMSIFLAFMIGTIFTSSSLAIGLTLFVSLMGTTAMMLLSNYRFVHYIWITHSDLTQFMPGVSTLLPDMTLLSSLLINLVYAVLFLAVTFITFIRRDVTA